MIHRNARLAAFASALLIAAVGAVGAEELDKIAIETPDKPVRLEGVNGKDLLSGKNIALENLKGHVVVIDLWATWCGPCVKELPDLIKFQAKHQKEKFTYLGFSVDEVTEEKNVIKFAKSKRMNYPVLFANRGFVEMLGEALGRQIQYIPTKIVIDRSGKVAFFIEGSPAQDKQVNKEYHERLLKLIAEPVPSGSSGDSPS